MMRVDKYPKGWDEERVRALIAEYDAMTEDDWIRFDEAAEEGGEGQTSMTVPTALVPEIRRLIAAHRKSA